MAEREFEFSVMCARTIGSFQTPFLSRLCEKETHKILYLFLNFKDWYILRLFQIPHECKLYLKKKKKKARHYFSQFKDILSGHIR